MQFFDYLMVIFQLKKLYGIKLDRNIIIYCKDSKDAVVAYLRVLYLQSPEETEENHDTYQARYPVNQPKSEPGIA
jgi:hypothetical protein